LAIDWPSLDPLIALPPLVMLHLLIGTSDTWHVQTPLVILFAVGLVFRDWLRTPAYWYAVATVLGTAVYLHWSSADNHQYLFVYACLALCTAFSLARDEQADALAQSCRWLVGLCMFMATVWKLASPHYLDGSFFHYTLLADERFAHFAHWTCGIPLEALAENRDLRTALVEGHLHGLDLARVHLAGSPAVASLATLLTWWTLAIEATLATLFLWPDRPRIARWRNALLILFAITTYSIAPVRGFGWMLMLLGWGQCGQRDNAFRWTYLIALLAIQACTLPWPAVLDLLWR
jgi:hypothetical protein